MLLANVCAGSSVAATQLVENGVLGWDAGCSQQPCENGLRGYKLMSAGLGSRRCAFRWTRPLGGGRWRNSRRNLLGIYWCPQKICL